MFQAQLQGTKNLVFPLLCSSSESLREYIYKYTHNTLCACISKINAVIVFTN